MRAAFALAALSMLTGTAEAEDAWRPDLIAKYESNGGQNIPNFRFDGVDGPHSAGGVCQMLTSTWLRIAPTIDIDVVKFPVAGSAPEFTQWQACWKLWSVEGYHPWTCNGCNAKLRKVIGQGGDIPDRHKSAPVTEKVAERPKTRVEAFNDRLAASSSVYSSPPHGEVAPMMSIPIMTTQ